MVYHHLGPKFSYIANQFKTSHSINFIRNAIPTGTSNTSAPLFGSSTGQAAGSGAGGHAGGAGGAKWHAGSRAHQWAQQPSRLSQAQATTDGNVRPDDDEQRDGVKLKHPEGLQRSRPTSTPRLARPRRNSLSTPLVEKADEPAQLEPRLSAEDFRAKYRVAILREQHQERPSIERTPTASRPSTPLSRSVSSASLFLLSTPTPPRSPALVRASSTSVSRGPPLADKPRLRRASTSAGTTASWSSAPLEPSASSQSSDPARRPRPRRRHSQSSVSVDADAHSTQATRWKKPLRTDLAVKRSGPINEAISAVNQSIQNALRTGKKEIVQRAVQAYLADDRLFNVQTHNIAMDALARVRTPADSPTQILSLYNQLFDHKHLRPNVWSYELLIGTLADRDREILAQKKFLDKRLLKRRLVNQARGKRDEDIDEKDLLFEHEVQELERLNKTDVFTPAINAYNALGREADKLTARVVNSLLNSAALRQRHDLALSLFDRLEKSLYQKPTALAFNALLGLYGREKDADSIMTVFEGYLAQRAAGTLSPPTVRGRSFQPISVKHRYDAEPLYLEKQEATYPDARDELVWSHAIDALFEAGDPERAIGLVERMLAATDQENTPAGYPERITGMSGQAIVSGFVRAGQVEAAQAWFDRFASDPEQPRDFFHHVFFSAADSDEFLPFLNHVYDKMMERASRDFLVSVSAFSVVNDMNLVRAYRAEDPAERQAALDRAIDVQNSYTDAVQRGLTDTDTEISSGHMQRLIAALGINGRFVDAARVFEQMVDTARNVWPFVKTEADRKKWLLRLTNSSCHVLGSHTWTGQQADSVAPLDIAAGVAATLSSFTLPHKWSIDQSLARLVAISYLTAKGNNTSIRLTADQWFAVIHSFAIIAAAPKVAPPDFPGFEMIMDDFHASGVEISSRRMRLDWVDLTTRLRRLNMPRRRMVAILSMMDQSVANRYAEREPMPQSPVTTEATRSPTSSSAGTPATSVASAGQEKPKQAKAAPSQSEAPLPAAPSTPPTYLAQGPDQPAFSQYSSRIDDKLSQDAFALVNGGRTDQATAIVLKAVQQGVYAHPDVLSRLVEAVGRSGKMCSAEQRPVKLSQIRQIYLVAYAALNLLVPGSSQQAMAWVALEDRMIIGLTHLDALEDIAAHRDRLIASGTAPSADAYAAMIVNMRETTDDAAVALRLFEESQRYNVKPNTYLFNTLISKLSRARRAAEAIAYFELMRKSGLQPSAITYGAVINACCKVGDDASADILFREMVKSPGFKPRVPPYNTMIQFYTSKKPSRERALHYYQQLLQAGVKPTGHTYKLLLDAYGSIGEPDPESMSDVFRHLLRDPEVTVTGAHWASLINAWGVAKRDLGKAIETFESISSHAAAARKSEEQLPNAVVYEALLNVFLANGRPDLCDQYLARMKREGIRMTSYVANTLIKGHIARGDMASARAVFESLQDPPPGYAAVGNHAVERHPNAHFLHAAAAPSSPASPALSARSTPNQRKQQQQQQQHASRPANVAVETPVYREPSTWETMVQAELEAGEHARAAKLMDRIEQRAYPDAVVQKIRKLLSEVGVERIDLSGEKEEGAQRATM